MAQLDLNGIKTAIKTILDNANVVGGSPIDLSNGLQYRVKKVLKIDPEKIVIQVDLFPLVTILIQDKTIKQSGIAINQVNAKRETDLTIEVLAACWDERWIDVTQDPPVEQAEKLAENIEEILRSNPTLGGTVLWAIPTATKFYSNIIAEDVNLRSAVITLNARAYY